MRNEPIFLRLNYTKWFSVIKTEQNNVTKIHIINCKKELKPQYYNMMTKLTKEVGLLVCQYFL